MPPWLLDRPLPPVDNLTRRELLDVYALLSQIAPTLAQTGEFPDGGVPWQQQLRVTGRGLGREERAQQLVAEVESQFAQAREEHPQFEGRTAAVDMAQDGHYILESQDRRMRFFTSLGFKAPDETGPISPERTRLLDQDVLVVFAKREEVEDDPLFRALDAVAEGRVKGNRRIDTMVNIAANPHVGLLFMVPGLDETLRVNGRAEYTTDETLLVPYAVNGRVPNVGIVVEVEELFFHCARAFLRSSLWSPDRWPDRSALPTLGTILRDQVNTGLDAEDLDADLEQANRDLY